MDCLGLLDGMFVQLAFNSVYPFVKQVLNASQCRPEWQARGGTFFQAPKKILDSLPRWQSELHGRTTYNTCALTYFFPVKSRKGAIFFLSDLPSRSHFRYLETSTSQGPWEGEHQGQKSHMAQRKELFLSAGKKNKVIDVLMNLVNCLNEVLVFLAFFWTLSLHCTCKFNLFGVY